ncbi:MAG: cation-translocating P-type ATPase [Cyclobacteriaceae bacterium]|nr:cation-translocating P-type ATPase [Cyclobacteriaceae bacterium]
MNWHITSVTETLNVLNSQFSGLSPADAEERLLRYGMNELPEKKKRPSWVMFLNQFKEVMILILITAAVISGVIGDLKDTIVILAIVVLNAVVGFIQEYRAEKAMEALKKMAASSAYVRREGKDIAIESKLLVPGDIILLEAGNIVPADMRLIDIHSLKVEEASLTGESHAVEKITGELTDAKSSIGDRLNMAFKGTLVTYGNGIGVVTATGSETQLGQIASMLQSDDTLTPLQKRLTEFGKKLSLGVLAICITLFGIGFLRGEDPVRMLLTALSLAVAAIPEALPALTTIALALGAKRMVRKNALIRKLPAVETLGSVTYICSDKTGTLTQNNMTVKEVWKNEHANLSQTSIHVEQLLPLTMLLNQDVKTDSDEKLRGDSTEVALLHYALEHEQLTKEDIQKFPRINEVPFDSIRKCMTTIHKLEGGYLVLTKGALESVIERCVNDPGHADARNQNEVLAKDGKRVLAFGAKYLEVLPAEVSAETIEKDLQLTGIAGLMDPPREEAQEAIRECHQAGIAVVMITGDHPLTATAIAREIKLLNGDQHRVITGVELASMSQREFEMEIENIRVYARVSPEQKLHIVQTLQQKNHFVAMTGDGVNDAPALKRANIGIAMGITGSDVSKEVAHMILLDDNFATIVKAVKEGRRIFDNIRKFIRYIMTGNAGEIWTIMLAPLVGLPIPLLPIHILWVNLVTDGLPGLALAAERSEQDSMLRPPRNPSESIFAHGLGVHIVWVGLLIGAVCLGIQAWAIHDGNTHWQTMVFTVLCLSQMGHVMAIRSEFRSLFQQGLFSNLPLLGAVMLTFALQLVVIYWSPANEIFNTAPLSFAELLICIGSASIIFFAVEIEKIIRNRKSKGA